MKRSEPLIRQIHLVGMNTSIAVLSAYEHEDIDFLSQKALLLFKEIDKEKR